MRQWNEDGRIRYLGITHYRQSAARVLDHCSCYVHYGSRWTHEGPQMPKPTHRSAKAAAALTPEIVEIFGAPPLLSTENGRAYDDMLAKLANAVQPDDIIACLLIKDIADKRIEIARYRRQKAALVEKATQQERETRMDWLRTRLAAERYSILHQIDDEVERRRAKQDAGGESDEALASRAERMIADRLRRSEAAYEPRFTLLQEAPTELDFAGSLANWISAMEQLDALERAADKQFQNALQALDDHLDGLGPKLKANLTNVIDGEAITIVPAEPGSRSSRARTG